MQNIVLCGGPGCGKTSFAKKFINKIPVYRYQYMSYPAVRIPLTLFQTTYPHLLELSKEEYLRIVKENRDVNILPHSRTECTIFGLKLMERYGAQIMGEVGYSFCDKNATLLDGLARLESLIFLRKKRFLVVGFTCAFSTQVQRRMQDMKPMDAKEDIEKMIKETNEYLDAESCVKNADLIFNTDSINTDEIIEEVLNKLKMRTTGFEPA